MATAKKNEVKTVENIELTLSLEEAILLKSILFRIGGNPYVTARGIADDIHDSLDDLGIPYLNHNSFNKTYCRIWFDDESLNNLKEVVDKYSSGDL